MSTRRPPFRVSKARAQVNLIQKKRRRSAAVIRTPAGSEINREQLDEWVSNHDDREAIGHIVDVYIQYLCYSVNERRGLVAPNRVMLMQPQTFYTAILAPGGEVVGSQSLRTAGITAAEFVQLEYFFIPIDFGRHSCLAVVSPRNHTIELLDAMRRTPRNMTYILHAITRFLIHELGSLADPIWRILHGRCPRQNAASDCGNYTCFFAKAMAFGRPLNPTTDIGQGPNFGDELKVMKFRLVDDLLLDSWTAATMPFGNVDHRLRFAPGGMSEPQHGVFRHVWQRPLVRIYTLRSRTGRWDHIRTNLGLLTWCLSQPQLRDANGNLRFRASGRPIMRMEGMLAHFNAPWRELVTRIEWRTMDILNGGFP